MIFHKKSLLLLGLVLLGAFLPNWFDLGGYLVKAETISVCAEGCATSTIRGALSLANPSDVISIETGYNSSTEDYIEGGSLNVMDANLTIRCANTDVRIGTSSPVTLSFDLTHSSYTGFSVQNCYFENFSIPVATSSVISGNIFTRSSVSSNQVGVFVSSVEGSSDVSITNNTFIDSYAGTTSSKMLAIGIGNSNFLIASNTFRYGVESTAQKDSVIYISGNSRGTISNNYFTLTDFSGSGDGHVAIEAGGNSGNLDLEITHNTIYAPSYSINNSSSTMGMIIGDGGNASSVVNVTSTYNLFYFAGSSSLIGERVNKDAEASVVNYYSDYNSFYHWGNNTTPFGSASNTVNLVVGGHSLDDVDPFFRVWDNDSNNNLYPAPFSSHLDVDDLGGDIGAYSGERGNTFYVDDDDSIDYVEMFATNTTWVSSCLRNGDTVVFRPGNYEGFSLVSSTKLTGNVIIKGDGLGATPIIRATANNSAISLTGINSSTIRDLTLQNASTTYFAITNANFRYSGVDYDKSSGIGGIISNGYTFIAKDGDMPVVWYEDDGYNVEALLDDYSHDWHLALGSIGEKKVTAFVPHNYAADSASLATLWGIFGWVEDVWVTSTFIASEDIVVNPNYTYNTSSIAEAGITMISGYTDPPTLAKAGYAGIKFISSNNNLVQSVTSTGNGYGLSFSGSSNGNYISSTVVTGSVLYDVRNDGTGSNYFNNVNFSTASSSIINTGNVTVQYRARGYVTDVYSSPLAGVTVRVVDGRNTTTTLLTEGSGYTAFTDYLPAFTMSSSSVALTSGGYNPYTVSTVASSTYEATSTSANLTSNNQTFSLAMATSAAAVGITLSTTTLNVTEGGVTSSYTMVLDSAPTANVVIALSLSNSSVTLSTSSLFFTTANWDSAQTITVTAVNDDLENGTHTSLISHTVSSTDLNYHGMSVSGVTTTISDNDTAGVTLSTTAVSVTEGGATGSYTIVLDSEPTADVVVALNSNNGNISLSTSSITFTSSNWDTIRTVTVTAVDDSSVESTHTSIISQTASSSDTNYNLISIASVTVTITDNDFGGGGGGGGGGGYNLSQNTTTTVTSTIDVVSSTVGAGEVVGDTVFTNPKKFSVRSNKAVVVNYLFTNSTTKSVKIEVRREVHDSVGDLVDKIVTRKIVKANKTLKGRLSDKFFADLPTGDYQVKYSLYVGKKLIGSQIQNFVVKNEKKYFMNYDVAATTGAIMFDTGAFDKMTKYSVLPLSVPVRYVYTNTTNKSQSVNIEKYAQNYDKSIYSRSSANIIIPAKKSFEKVIEQTLEAVQKTKYVQIVIRVKDQKTQSVLAENHVKFWVK